MLAPGKEAGVESGAMLASAVEPRRARVWRAALAFWSLMGALESVTARVRGGLMGLPTGWGRAFVNNMPWWLLWGVLTPVAIALARRYPLDSLRWVRPAVTHLIAALVLSVVHLSIEAVIFTWTNSWFGLQLQLSKQIYGFLLNYLMLDLVTYALIVGAWTAYDYYRRSTQLALGLAEARMQALRSELNPHFFFNSLNAVSGLVRRGDNDAAVRMLARMGELLSATLDHQRGPEIPLREELSLLDRYLDIERVRFGERLTIDVAHDASADGALVPTFMLQPLVENAIRHGISRRSGRSRIEVSAHRENGSLLLAVRDTGEGLSQTEPREGIGLSNTRARLGELYGNSASLVLENAPGGGACVRVTLPFREARHG